jgi:sec-independent protein translocase protein TatC
MNEFGSQPSQTMDLMAHLDELRRRILICLGFFTLAVIVLFSRGYAILAWLEKPAHSVISEFIFVSPTEAFMTYLKAVVLISFIVTFPVILFQLWRFIAPAISTDLRRRIFIWILFALGCFIGGIVFSYQVLVPAAFHFLVSFAQGIARPMISIAEYISFAVVLILLGGCAFEIPVILGLFTEVGIVRSRQLRQWRRYAILINLIIAAIVTPTQDIFNLLILAVPMIVLYEVGIILAILIEKRRAKK